MVETVSTEFTRNPTAQLVYINIRDLQNSMKLNLDSELQFKSLMSCVPSTVEEPIKNEIKQVLRETELRELANEKYMKFPYWCAEETIRHEIYKANKQLRYGCYLYVIRLIVNRMEVVYHFTETRNTASDVLI